MADLVWKPPATKEEAIRNAYGKIPEILPSLENLFHNSKVAKLMSTTYKKPEG